MVLTGVYMNEGIKKHFNFPGLSVSGIAVICALIGTGYLIEYRVGQIEKSHQHHIQQPAHAEARIEITKGQIRTDHLEKQYSNIEQKLDAHISSHP